MEKLSISRARTMIHSAEASLESFISVTQLSGGESDEYLRGQIKQPHAHLGEGEQNQDGGSGQDSGEIAQSHAQVTADKQQQSEGKQAPPPAQGQTGKKVGCQLGK